MQDVMIDLKRNPEIADVAKDFQPGDRVDLHAVVKGIDDQTFTLTVESASEGKDPDDEDTPEGGNEGADDRGDEDAGGAAMAQQPQGSDPMGLLTGENASLG